jgi:hypothetical protein
MKDINIITDMTTAVTAEVALAHVAAEAAVSANAATTGSNVATRPRQSKSPNWKNILPS